MEMDICPLEPAGFSVGRPTHTLHVHMDQGPSTHFYYKPAESDLTMCINSTNYYNALVFYFSFSLKPVPPWV